MQMDVNAKKYLEVQIRTASKEQLLIMLFDGAIKFCEQAKGKIDEKDIEGSHNLLIRAQRIMTELISTLNKSVGEEIFNNLIALYTFVYRRLITANVEKDKNAIDDALRILNILRDTWKEAIEKSKNTQMSSDAKVVNIYPNTSQTTPPMINVNS